MGKPYTKDTIITDAREKIYLQSYEKQPAIDGVKIINLKTSTGEEGDFGELLRLSDDGFMESLPDFKIAQINRTKLNPGSVKAWHIHFNQDEIWYLLPTYHLLVGLWDIRDDSPTKNEKMRVVLGEGNSQLLYIPAGVAHGSANLINQSVEMIYFVNKKFDIENPDERRIPWDTLGKEFWEPQKD